MLMWKKILLVLLLVVVGIPAAGLGYLYFRKPEMVPASSARVPMTPERIARGKYLFENIADCDGCHSQRDFDRVGGPVVETGRGAGNNFSELIPSLPGTIVAANLTNDPETGLGNWSDG